MFFLLLFQLLSIIHYYTYYAIIPIMQIIAVRCRVEDGDASADNWKDSKGKALAPDRFWSSGIESEIAGDDEGPCKGIELNIWERAKVIFCIILLIHIICIICIILIIALHARYVVTSCTRWWAAGASMGDSMLLITANPARKCWQVGHV
jgi:hypothetical protein